MFGGCAAVTYIQDKLASGSKENLGERQKTHKDNPSSLIIYPIPYPSLSVGPNPNRRNAGFPQLDVERIAWFSRTHPASSKIAGILVLLLLLLEVELEEAGEALPDSVCGLEGRSTPTGLVGTSVLL